MSAEQGEVARARYLGPTDTVGARIVVRWRGRQRTLPFNYAVSDTFVWAVAHTVGVREHQLRRLHGRRQDNPDSRLYEILG